MAITSVALPRPARVAAPRRDDLAAVTREIREHLTALGFTLHAVRLAAGGGRDPSAVLDLADRQVKALAALTDELHDQGRG
jgi:hypothetical protein